MRVPRKRTPTDTVHRVPAMMRAIVLTLVMAWSLVSLGADDRLLVEASWAEENGNFPKARSLYQQYLDTRPDIEQRQSLSIRISVLDEAQRFGSDEALTLFLEALAARDRGEFEIAIDYFKTINSEYPDSYLNDDALYLEGYIALMDRFDFVSAHESLRRLQREYPDTRYADTALYSEAIALEQLGNTLGARERFLELRKRHTEFSVNFLDQRWPKGSLLSRYWFDRADKRLTILDSRLNDAAKVVERRVLTGQSQTLRVTVDVGGMNLVLLLGPSSATSNMVLKDRANQPLDLPQTRFFAGIVEGDKDSWVRVAITGDAIEGVASTFGARYVLAPNTLMGTIDYYLPKLGASTEDQIKLQDYVIHPPEGNASDLMLRRVFSNAATPADNNHAVTRVARMAIVVDSQYNDYYGGNGLVQALSVLNIADGIYREDFGLSLEISSALVFTDRSDDPINMGAVTLEQVLRGFRDYRLANKADLPDISLAYLFTGNQTSDEAIGLAWIGGACRTDGYDVGVTTPSTFGDLLVTHELGHSLGAQHDSDTSCASSTNQLMWPRISSMTQQEFTHCTQDVLAPNVASGCYIDALDLSIELKAESSESVDVIIRNHDTTRDAPDTILTLDHAAVEFDSVPGQCFAVSSAELQCNTGTVGPGGSAMLRFALGPMLGNSMTLLAELKPVGFADVHKSNNTVQLDARKAEDGSTDIVIASINPSSDPSMTADMSNQGYSPASSVGGGSAGGALLWLALPLGMVVWRRLATQN